MDTAVVQKPERDNAAKRASQLTPDVQRREEAESGAGTGLPLFMQASSTPKGLPQIQRQVEEEEEEEEELIQPKLDVQTKLTVGAPDDEYEREADRVADKVMRMPAGGGELEDDVENPPQIQTRSTGTGSRPSIAGAVTNTISSPGNGSPLNEMIRSRSE